MLWAVRWGMVILQPCRWKFSQKNFVANSIRLNLIKKNKQKSLFEPPFGILVDLCSLSIAWWKRRGRFFVCHNWTFYYLLRLRVAAYWAYFNRSCLLKGILSHTSVTVVTQFVTVEATITGLADQFTVLRRHRPLFTLVVCIFCFLLGLPLCTQVIRPTSLAL